eukprot:jgi/Mesvir1/12085/Mv00361-RA.1
MAIHGYAIAVQQIMLPYKAGQGRQGVSILVIDSTCYRKTALKRCSNLLERRHNAWQSVSSNGLWSNELLLSRTSLLSARSYKHVYCYAGENQQAAGESQGLSEVASLTREIRKLGRDGQGEKAFRMLKDAGTRGLAIDLMAVTAVIGACIQGRQMAVAEEAFSHFFESGELAPDDVVFVAMIRGYGECKPPQWDKVGLTMSKMRRFGLRPSIMHYNQLLALAVAANDTPRATQLIDRMVSERVEPDDATMDAIRRKRVLKSYMRKQFPFWAE